MTQKIKPKLRDECESNGETLDDIHSLFGVTMDDEVKEIDLAYLDGEDFVRFSTHVAYSDQYVYISARDGGLTVRHTFVSAPADAVVMVARSR